METIKHKNLKPSLINSFGHGREAMVKYFLYLLLVFILLAMVTSPGGLIKSDIKDFDDFHDLFDVEILALGIMTFFLGMLLVAYSLLVIPIFEYGADMIYVQAVRDIKPDFEELIKGFKERYLHIVLANLLKSALVMLGIIFLIIPGIIIACRLAFVSYLVVDKKMDPIVAVEESWKLTRGHGWTIFFMAISSFFLCVLGLLFLIVGIIPAIIWSQSAFASLYEMVLQEKHPETEITIENNTQE